MIALFLWRQVLRDELAQPRLWAVGLLALVLVAVHVGHLFAVRNEGWGTNDARMSFGYVLANLRVNGKYYLGDEPLSVLFTVLAMAGLRRATASGRSSVRCGYFLLFFGIFLTVLRRQL